MEFEERLKQLIKTKYSRLSDLAEKFNMNYSQLSQYLNGKKVSIEFLNKIIKEFPETDLNWLLRDEYDSRVEEGIEVYRAPLNKDQIIVKMESLLGDLKEQLAEKS